MITARRSFLLGATAFLAAPSIVRAASLMPVSVIKPSIEAPIPPTPPPGVYIYNGAFKPAFVAPQGSIYMRTSNGDLYVNWGGSTWARAVTPSVTRHSPRDRHEAA